MACGGCRFCGVGFYWFGFYPILFLLLQLGVSTLWGGGVLSLSSQLFVVLVSSLKDSQCGILMPSGLLVWQIPYREMLSLGLKVSIRRGSRLPACAV